MFCVLNFVLFAATWQMVLLHSPELNLSRVDVLVERGRGIESIPPGNYHTHFLKLTYNHITSLPEFVFLNNSYKSLKRIELQHNKIDNIHVTAFKGLRELESLVLSDNNLTSLDPYVFKHNVRLTKLELSRNKLNFKRLEVFLVQHSLETLILSENRIEQIYEPTFTTVPNLKNLILNGNILYVIAANSFKSLSKLQYLSLANTGVYHLSQSMFDNNLPRIIDLQGTPLAGKFDPPLNKVTENAVKRLINLQRLITGNATRCSERNIC